MVRHWSRDSWREWMRIIAIFPVLIFLLCPPCFAVDSEPIGWATAAGGTTGGQGGEVVTVTNKAEFVNAVSGDTPRIVQVLGTIHGDYNIPNVGSNKTILGIGYDARIVGFSVKVSDVDNVIVRNLTFQGAVPQDGLICRRATHVWIDHCTFLDCADGLCDITDQSDYITVSWCRFCYTSKVNPHRFACLVGSTDDNPTDVGKLNVTFHHNWWGAYVDQRMPRGRYGKDHVFNNYYSCTGNSYCVGGSWGFKVLLENNYFNQVKNPIADAGRVDSGTSGTFTVEIKSVGNIFNACTGTMSGYGSAFVPPYSYTLDASANIPSIVTEGAGTTILVGDSALWPVQATVPNPANGDFCAATTATLSWRAGSTAVSHNVYFGTSPTELVSFGNQTATAFTPPTLTADTKYYWRVDEVTADNTVIPGQVWMFKTVPTLPSDLIHYWPFDVDFLDVSKVYASNPNHPFGAAWLDSNAKRLGSGCLDLTYPKDGLIVGWSDTGTNRVFPNAAPMTISLWFKPTALPASDKTACMLGTKVGTLTTAKTFRIELLPSGACRLTVDTQTPEFGNLPVLNQWNHVLVSIDASGQLRGWLNASEAGSVALMTSASNNYNGQYTGIGFYGDEPSVNGMSRGEYTGYIDDVAVWSRWSDRTFAELLYNDGLGRLAVGNPVFPTDLIENPDAVELAPYAGRTLRPYTEGIGIFRKISGPDWLVVSPNGNLSGAPKDADTGLNTFTVVYENTSGQSDTAVMTIHVSNVYSGVKGLEDLAGIAEKWLWADCGDFPPCSGADQNGDRRVDMLDCTRFASAWLADETLVLSLPFEETDGNTTKDISLYSRTASLTGGPTWAEGISGGGLLLDGLDDFAEFPDFFGISGGRSRTVCAWIQTTQTGGMILTCGGLDTGTRWLFFVNNSKLQLGVSGGNILSNQIVADGQWHHVAAVLEAPETGPATVQHLRLYIDGQPDAGTYTNPSLAINTGTACPVRIGAIQQTSGLLGSFFSGRLDDVRLYERALSQQEIQTLYQQGNR
ncbi:MAG TPA: LamG domain-containing protein [Anaerohalosphaeraceae bacterium]|nr:LamG domain-containing protein [Anaerohalosphaeraceae bacterium]